MHVVMVKRVACCLLVLCSIVTGGSATCQPAGDVLCCGSTAYDSTRYRCSNGKVTGFDVDSCAPGRSVIVHLFNWKWTDIATECETFLGPNQFCGVQVSPPNEHLVITNPQRPWWERYQPVSYKLGTRSGTESEFTDMVQRCNAVDVRIFVDAVINHMCGYGSGTGTGSAGSSYNSQGMQFPGVPYGSNDFNCCNCGGCTTTSCDIENYLDADQVRNCRLLGLLDLKMGSEYVRGKVISFLNKLVDIGVAGFRVDACKHMWPGDLEYIYERINDLSTVKGFPVNTRPFIFSEVIDHGGEAISSAEYTHLGRVTEFRYSRDIGRAFRGLSSLSALNQFQAASWHWQWLPSDRALVFVDNHDNQRGHGAGGADILTFYNELRYRLATAFTLAYPYGFARIMSSYRWDGSDDGPPHESDSDWTISDVQVDGSTQQCLEDWVCEHRWPVIKAMVEWRSAAEGAALRHWWSDCHRQIAFARAGRAFIAINDDDWKSMNVTLDTGLPAGVYCDVTSGQLTQDRSGCTGRSVTVSGDGRAEIFIEAANVNSTYDPLIAIHIGAVQGSACVTQLLSPPSGFKRTIVFMKFTSQPGQQLFLRGGIGYSRRPQCNTDPSQCAIPIQHRLCTTPPSEHYRCYRTWAAGDTKLDWHGAESGQDECDQSAASGSPTVWTTNAQSNSDAYHSLNRYGEHYWLWDVDMDCSATESGWFELKAYTTGGQPQGWENDVSQSTQCTGDVGGCRPYTSTNHFARCGFVNVFEFQQTTCTVNSIVPPLTGFQRTVIFVEFRSRLGEYLFLRGGISHDRRPQCNTDPSQCSIPIQHRLSTTPNTDHYAAYRAWAAGDTKLDWNGAEAGQGQFNERTAGGSPTVWTTNDQSNSAAYHSLNRYGAYNWMFDVDMDCASTESGWFELKIYITNDGSGSAAWERDVTQAGPCHGDIGGNRPYASTNHFARCGYINTFVLEQGSCSIHSIEF